MGDAIFSACYVWKEFDSILVIWGDQANLSTKTLKLTLEEHRMSGAGCTVPLVRVPKPYVQYDFDDAKRLVRIRQTRESDNVDANGYSDVGIFALRTQGLLDMWLQFRTSCSTGPATAEINFLPFLPFLTERGWHIHIVAAGCPDEARGINDAADLAFARQRLSQAKVGS